MRVFHDRSYFFRAMIVRRHGAVKQMHSWVSTFLRASRKQWTVRGVCLALFFFPFAVYLLKVWEDLPQQPPALDVGVVVVSAALGGLVLNAGLNLRGPKREETVRVAQKFIVVVILMLIFLPSIHVVELMGSIDINSFEPDETAAWGRGVLFYIAATSFFLSVGLFIIALVDVVFAMEGIHSPEYASWANDRISRDTSVHDAG